MCVESCALCKLYKVHILQYSVYVSGDEKEDEVVILYSRFCQGSAEWARYSTILKCTVEFNTYNIMKQKYGILSNHLCI